MVENEIEKLGGGTGWHRAWVDIVAERLYKKDFTTTVARAEAVVCPPPLPPSPFPDFNKTSPIILSWVPCEFRLFIALNLHRHVASNFFLLSHAAVPGTHVCLPDPKGHGTRVVRVLQFQGVRDKYFFRVLLFGIRVLQFQGARDKFF